MCSRHTTIKLLQHEAKTAGAVLGYEVTISDLVVIDKPQIELGSPRSPRKGSGDFCRKGTAQDVLSTFEIVYVTNQALDPATSLSTYNSKPRSPHTEPQIIDRQKQHSKNLHPICNVPLSNNYVAAHTDCS